MTVTNLSAWLERISYGFLLALVSVCALAQEDAKLLHERTPDQQPTLLVLGTGHFHNPGRDLFNTKVDDVLGERRQQEIVALVEQLASFRPTHIAVERPSKDQSRLDARYRDYREGRYKLSRAEDEQIGLRLAAKLGLARVYAVDWNEEPPGNDQDYDWPSYGNSHGQKALVAAISDPKRAIGLIELETQSIGTWLLKLNRPDALLANHRAYFDWARVGDDERQPGANWVGAWYARNLRIFNNVLRLTDRSQDRILVIYGQGHAYLLRQFATESLAFRLVDVDAVLKNE
jgi:hypothetical protein